MVRTDSFSSVPPHIQPPMAQVPSAIRELISLVPAMFMYSSMVILLFSLIGDHHIFWPSQCALATVLSNFCLAVQSSDQLSRQFDAELRPAIAVGTQLRAFFHLQNHRRKVLFSSFVRLPRVDLKGNSRCGHSRSNGRRELENQSEILVH